jgi:hypothetical protein
MILKIRDAVPSRQKVEADAIAVFRQHQAQRLRGSINLTRQGAISALKFWRRARLKRKFVCCV